MEQLAGGVGDARLQIAAHMLNIVGARCAVTCVRRHLFPPIRAVQPLRRQVPEDWNPVDELALRYFDKDGEYLPGWNRILHLLDGNKRPADGLLSKGAASVLENGGCPRSGGYNDVSSPEKTRRVATNLKNTALPVDIC